jgi:hypothetical protein
MVRTLATAVIILTICTLGSVRAALVDNGGGLVYDTDLNITWYSPSLGPMTWSEAVSWAASLGVSNTNVRNVTGWRLPSALSQDGSGPCGGYDCTGSEMGHLYYKELDNAPHGPLTNKGPFANLQPLNYWTAKEWESYSGNAWVFSFYSGLQGFVDKNNSVYCTALAVHDGNVGQSLRSVKEGVLSDLAELLAVTANLDVAAALQGAIHHLTNSLSPALWAGNNHLNLQYGETVFREGRDAIDSLNESLKRGAPVETLIDSLIRVDKLLAQNAINAAVVAHGDAGTIAKAQDEIAKAVESAVTNYGVAWRTATEALKTPRKRPR